MFKKSLAALAILGAFAGVTSAATVQLYGVVDEALVYTNNNEANKATENTVALQSGYNAGSRFGLKGVEDLGNGLKVGFKLENQFNADDGSLKNDRLFHREAALTVYSQYGTLAMGRMGGVGSSAGTYDLVYAYADAFDGGDNDILGLAASSRYDNMLTYQTPKFAGVQATVQYSFKENSVKQTAAREGSSAANRYASAAVTGDFGPLALVAAYEYQNYASAITTGDLDDGHTVYFGGNYDCGFAKTFAMVQYFKGINYELDDNDAPTVGKSNKGYGLHLGTQFPVLAGNLTVGAYYVDATTEEANKKDVDFDYIGLSTRYTYSLSKRTTFYTGVGYSEKTVEEADGDKKTKFTQAYVGLTHTF